MLRRQGYNLRHSPRLHAKVFRFADSAIIGSANASANGLGFEGNELNNWSELGALITDPKRLQEIDNWVNAEFCASQEITTEDLRKAGERYSERRASRPPVVTNEYGTVLKALSEAGAEFRDRPIYLACDTEDLNAAGVREQQAVRNELGNDLYLYEGWGEMPRDAYLIHFWEYSNREYHNEKFAFQGFYNTAKILGDRKGKGTVYQIIKKVPSIPTNTSVGKINRAKLNPIGDWYKLLSQIKSSTPTWKKDHGCCVQLAEIAQKLQDGTWALPRA